MNTFKLKPFTPLKVKADLAFIGVLAASFGANIPTSTSNALIGAGALIALTLNAAETYVEAHVHISSKSRTEADKALAEVRTILPALNDLTTSLPGNIGQESRNALAIAEKGPVDTGGWPPIQ